MPKTILITGTSTGFGRDTAETLARAGHRVFASMRDSQAKNRAHAQALRNQGIEVVELDVSSDASVERAVKDVLTRAGHLDVLINNAGVASAGITEAFTPDQAKVVFNTNVVGLLRTIRAVLPAMRRQGHGLIISQSRSVLYASAGADYAEAARREVDRVAMQIAAAKAGAHEA